jgi:hypothetical protein
MRILPCLLFAAALLPAQPGAGSAAAVTQAERAKLAALLPGPAPFGGKPSKPPAFFSADLYKYLDGGAEAYLQRGFVALLHQEYKAADVEITADIYDMGDPARAWGMYSAERPADRRPIPMGREGYRDEGALNFQQSVYYVKLLAFGEAARTAAILDTVARGISTRIGGKHE